MKRIKLLVKNVVKAKDRIEIETSIKGNDSCKECKKNERQNGSRTCKECSINYKVNSFHKDRIKKKVDETKK